LQTFFGAIHVDWGCVGAENFSSSDVGAEGVNFDCQFINGCPFFEGGDCFVVRRGGSDWGDVGKEGYAVMSGVETARVGVVLLHAVGCCNGGSSA
jgi:hypothetical protein